MQWVARENDLYFKSKAPVPKSIQRNNFTTIRGSFNRCKNIFYKEFGEYDVSMFDYSTKKHTSLFVYKFKNVQLPDFNLYPKEFGKSFEMPLFKFKKVTIKNNEEFSKNYLLYSPDVKSTESLFSKEVIDTMLNYHGISIECRNDSILLFREGARFDTYHSIDKKFQYGFEILSTLIKQKI